MNATLVATVGHDGQVVLLGCQRVFDVPEATHLLTFGAGLVGLRVACPGWRWRARRRQSSCHLHVAYPLPPTGGIWALTTHTGPLNLCGFHRLLGRRRRNAAGHLAHRTGTQDFFALVP